MQQLGRGKAFYDNFLHLYTSSRPPPLLGQSSLHRLGTVLLADMDTVALALTPQMLPPDQEVPMTETDFQLDGVLSPEGMVWREGAKEEKVIRR